MIEYKINNAEEMKNFATEFAQQTLRQNSKDSAIVLALKGELGAGKTTFLQGFALGLGIKAKILSPTFILMQKFKVKNSNFDYFFHFDLYRLESVEDLDFLNIKEIFLNPKNIIAIEWPERILEILPKGSVELFFSHAENSSRLLKIKDLNN